MPDIVVGTTFNAQDRVSKSFGRMSKGADKFGRKASKAFKKASMAGSGFGKITKGILAAGAIQRGLGLIEQGIGSVVTGFLEFDHAATGAAIKFKDVSTGAKSFEDALKEAKAAARDAGSVTEFTAAQSAKALEFLARAGFKSTEAIGSLRTMINLATATGEDFALVADMSSDLLGAFGLNADNTAQKIKNLNRLNDVLVQSVNSANVTVEDMFETMKIVGPIATGVLGASLEEVAALTSVLGNSGIKGSMAMTALKNAYLNLAGPAGKAKGLLKELGVTLKDGKGGVRKMTDVLAELGLKMKGFDPVKQAAMLDLIFGKRAIAGSKNLMDNIKLIKEFEQSLIDATGVSARTADIMRKTIQNRLKSLGSAATEAGFKFLSAFDKKGKDAITRLTKAVREFDMTPVIDAAKKTLEVFKKTVDVVKKFGPQIKDIAASFVIYFAAIKINAMWAFVSALWASNGAIGVMNGLLLANPIGLFILALVGAKIAVDLFIDNIDTIRPAIIKTFDSIKEKVKKTLAEMKRLSTNFIQSVLFGFAKLILKIAKIKGVFGFDTSGLDSMIEELNKLQKDAHIEVVVDTKQFDKLEASHKKEVAKKAPIQGPMILKRTGLSTPNQVVKNNITTGQSPNQTIQAPNQKEVEARQKIGISGKIQVAGLPKESTGELKSSNGSSINMEMLGANP